MPQVMDREGVDVFVAYSHEDEPLRDELKIHLSALKREGLIRVWDDRRVDAGAYRGEGLGLESADVVLLLISPDFLASDYAFGTEIHRALDRHAEGEARVIPVILRPVDWRGAPFSGLQALPQDGKPITSWADRDEAFLSVAQGIRTSLEELIRLRARLMARLNAMEVRNFTVFQDVRLDFCAGLNVLIGLNGTGKSQLMKLAYAVLIGWASSLREGATNGDTLAINLGKKLAGVFQPEDGHIARLVRRSKETAEIGLEYENGVLRLDLHGDGRIELQLPSPSQSPPGALFIPTREVLSMYEGFAAAYESRELSFDETYYDLCVALSARPLKPTNLDETAELLQSLEEILGGRVQLKGNRFYVGSGKDRTEAHLLAEGFRKIAVLAHLIQNGALVRNSILFWDEPEAHLNPYLITRVAKMLRELASTGMQVFVATHDYLLAHELSLVAEYSGEQRVKTLFFSFFQETREGAVLVESAPTLAEIDHNPILEEYAAHHERERSFFHENLRTSSEPKS